VALAESAGHSAERLVGVLAGMPYSKDVADYDGREVPFYKRAQLTAADLSLALGGQGPGRFDNLDRLTIFADNLVPDVLWVDGVLRYEEGLAARIDREVLILAGSPEEVEVLACAVHAVELVVGELQRGAGGAGDGAGLPAVEPWAAAGVQGPAPPPDAHRVLVRKWRATSYSTSAPLVQAVLAARRPWTRRCFSLPKP
jgi:hypothetical protein